MPHWLRTIIEAFQSMTKKTTNGHGKPAPPPIVSPPPPPPIVSPPPPPPIVSPPPPASGSVGPGPAWTGAAGSGFSGGPPTDPTRVTAKPRLRSWTPDQQRFTSDDFTLGVYASAKGGIREVVAYVEGSQLSVPVQTVHTYPNVLGQVNSEVGYFINLSASAFVAVNPKGTVQVYFRAVANDATLQDRIIGPLTFYPRAVEFDWSHTLGVDGDFATLGAALDALATAYNTGAAECGHLQCVTSGSYYLDNATVGSGNVSKGYTLLDCATGVAATLHRGDFDPNNTNNVWTWWSHVDNLCLGKGITVDVKNLQTIAPPSLRPWWIRGASFTNSINARDTLYWNNSPHPGLLVSHSSMSDVPISWSDGAFSQFSGAASTQCTYDPATPGIVKKWSNSDSCVGQVYFNAPFIAHCKETNTGVSFYRKPRDMFSVSYRGSGAGAYRIDHPGGITFNLLVDGLIVKALPLTLNPTAGYSHTVEELVAAINVYGQGFEATVIDGSFAVVAAAGASSGVVQPLGLTPVVQSGFFDFHTEFYHVYHNGPLENIIIYGNDVSAAEYSSTFLNFETGAADADVTNNSWSGHGNSPASVGGSHVALLHNFIDNGMSLFTPGNDDPYSEIAANVLASISLYNPPMGWPQVEPIHDNIWQLTWQGPPVGPNYINNTVVVDVTACVVNVSLDDLRPAGVALTQLCVPAAPYDRNYKLRAALDAAGPIAT